MTLENNTSIASTIDNEPLSENFRQLISEITELLAIKVRDLLNRSVDVNMTQNTEVSSTTLLTESMSTPARQKRSTTTEKKTTKTVNLSEFMHEQKIDQRVTLESVLGNRKAIEKIQYWLDLNEVNRLYPSSNPNFCLLLTNQVKANGKDVVVAFANKYRLKLYKLNFRSLEKDLHSSLATIRMDIDSGALSATQDKNKGVIVYLPNLDDVFNASAFSNERRLKTLIEIFNELIVELNKNNNVTVIGSCSNENDIHELLEDCSITFRTVEFTFPDYQDRIDCFNRWKSETAHVEFEVDAETFARYSSGNDFKNIQTLFQLMVMLSYTNPVSDLVVESSKSAKKNKKTKFLKYRMTEKIFNKALAELKSQRQNKSDHVVAVPDVKWNDIGSLQSLKDKIRNKVLDFIKYQTNPNLGKVKGGGIVLFGPPGCGKTLIAEALANERGFNFMMAEGGSFLSKYVGDSRKGVCDLFRKARQHAPTILMLDEFDVMCPKRGDGGESSKVAEQVLSALLVESNNSLNRANVFLIAATNRIDKVDRAILRSGRFDRAYYVGLPTPADRADILRTICQSYEIEVADNVDFDEIAFHESCHNFSGADLANLVRSSAEIVRERQTTNPSNSIDRESLLEAFNEVSATNLPKDLDYYEYCRREFANKFF